MPVFDNNKFNWIRFEIVYRILGPYLALFAFGVFEYVHNCHAFALRIQKEESSFATTRQIRFSFMIVHTLPESSIIIVSIVPIVIFLLKGSALFIIHTRLWLHNDQMKNNFESKSGS